MNVPNYFLADLPPEATLTPAMLNEACLTLKRNRQNYLAQRSTASLVGVLSSVAQSWLDAGFPFRRMALEYGPAALGFSEATLATGLDTFFRQLTAENLRRLLRQDLGHLERTDSFVALPTEEHAARAALARGPEFLVHITAGNLPPPTLHSMVLGWLARSAQFVKCARGSSLLPRLFAHSIYQVEPKLGACLELAEWAGGNIPLERELFNAADCVTVTGSDEAVTAIRLRVPPSKRFLGYGHRVSFAYVSSRMLRREHTRQVVERAAADVAAWDQQGCLSPHVIYVQTGGGTSPHHFTELLAEELENLEHRQPRGRVRVETSAAINSRRSLYAVRAAYSEETRMWASKNSTAWTVVYEAEPQFQFSCLNRFIYVKNVNNVDEALRAAGPVHGKVSTVGLAVLEEESREIALKLAAWGVTRICPLGQMQNPPLTWRHDGRPSLGDLVTWTDWEQDYHH